MISAGEFRKGMTFEMDGEPNVVIDFQHVKPGKGAAFVRTKYRNILTGATREEAFNPNDKFPKAHIETKQMQYLYADGDLYYFMDQETYEQIPLMEMRYSRIPVYEGDQDNIIGILNIKDYLVHVGAAILCGDGTVFTGVNVENASYGAGICAERSAAVTAVTQGHRDFRVIAICSDTGEAWPCGICRQFLYEFAPDMPGLRKNRFHGYQTVQPDVQDIPGSYG